MERAMSVDLGAITAPKMMVSYDKDQGVVCRLAFTVDMDPNDIRRILEAGKTTTLRAEIFTLALPLLPASEGRQIGLYAALHPSPIPGAVPIEVVKESATGTLADATGQDDPF